MSHLRHSPGLSAVWKLHPGRSSFTKMKSSILILLFRVTLCDFYTEFGIDKSADLREIKKAYKKLAIKLHPDKNVGDEQANEKFARINKIYEILKDEDLRKKYDLLGEEGLDDSGKKRGKQHVS